MRHKAFHNSVWRVLGAGLLSLSLVTSAQAAMTEYSVDDDEFGDGEVHQVRISTDDTSRAALFLSCYSRDELQMQLHTDGTIFPDQLEDNHMRLEVTHKVDTAPDAVTKSWQMNIMEYNDAWLHSGVRELAEEMLEGERLSMRLDRRGTIYRFDLGDAQEYIPKVLSACEQ